MEYLRDKPLAGVDLAKVCWRLRDAAMYERVIAVLRHRGVFSAPVWSYSVVHGHVESIRDYVYSQRHSQLKQILVREGVLEPWVPPPLRVSAVHIGVGSSCSVSLCAPLLDCL